MNNKKSHEELNKVFAKDSYPRTLGVNVIATTKWLALETVSYVDNLGVTKYWDRFRRMTRLPNTDVDAATIFAFTKSANTERNNCVLLVKQYRAAIERFTIELPAGLIDSAESVETAASRELQEETGYYGVIKTTSPVLAQSTLGMENVQLLTALIDLDCKENANPKQSFEDEDIQVLFVKRDTLLQELYRLSDAGNIIYADLFCLAYGIELSSSFDV